VYGLDRGTPIDRALIDRYLRSVSPFVHGHALEVERDRYATKLGATSVDIVDIDGTNPFANVVVDLCDDGSLPSGRYDVVILTQTLQYLRRPDAALRNAARALRPGGLLLVTVPVTSRIDPVAGSDDDFWRWTPAGLSTLLQTVVPEARIEIVGLGGVVATVGFTLGLMTIPTGWQLHPRNSTSSWRHCERGTTSFRSPRCSMAGGCAQRWHLPSTMATSTTCMMQCLCSNGQTPPRSST
jgi:SAM-dependent methyltransferase